MSKYSIKLKCLPTVGWVATFDDPEVIALFADDTLPTGFTEQADPQLVLSEISRLNPQAHVTLDADHLVSAWRAANNDLVDFWNEGEKNEEPSNT